LARELDGGRAAAGNELLAGLGARAVGHHDSLQIFLPKPQLRIHGRAGAVSRGSVRSHVDRAPGGVGLTLASIGLYGVMSYSMRRRTREIGIRMALGTKRLTVLRMILRQCLVVTAIRLAIGLTIAITLGRFTASVLYGTSGTDLPRS
jgi:predicted lysophospholipase L1 biosynthesis ABC-type transport system permease subunit